jgi:hypothetical protein
MTRDEAERVLIDATNEAARHLPHTGPVVVAMVMAVLETKLAKLLDDVMLKKYDA